MVKLLNIIGLGGLFMTGYGMLLMFGTAGLLGIPAVLSVGFGSLIMIGGFGGAFAIEQLVEMKTLLRTNAR